MAAVVITPADFSFIDPAYAEVIDGIALETVTPGAPLYLDPTTGRYGLADANAAGKQQFRGVSTKYAFAGQAIGVLKRGRCVGYTLTGNWDTVIYLSDTVGGMDTSAGTMSVPVGRIAQISESRSIQKCLYIEADWLRTWA